MYFLCLNDIWTSKSARLGVEWRAELAERCSFNSNTVRNNPRKSATVFVDQIYIILELIVQWRRFVIGPFFYFTSLCSRLLLQHPFHLQLFALSRPLTFDINSPLSPSLLIHHGKVHRPPRRASSPNRKKPHSKNSPLLNSNLPFPSHHLPPLSLVRHQLCHLLQGQTHPTRTHPQTRTSHSEHSTAHYTSRRVLQDFVSEVEECTVGESFFVGKFGGED